MEPVSTTALSIKGGLILLPIVSSLYKAMFKGAAPATGEDSGLLNDLGGYLMDLAKGVASSEADRRIALLQGQTHILGNEHIAKFTGLVLRQSIERFADQPAYQDLSKDLHALAVKVQSDWPTLIAQGAPDVAGLDGQSFVQQLHDSLVNDTPLPPLDPAFVKVWLMSVSRQHNLTVHIHEEVLARLAASLTGQLLADLATGIVSSDPAAVTAWKKTLLRSLSDLRQGQGQILLSIQDLKSILAGHQHDLMQSILGLCAGQEEIVALIQRGSPGLTNYTKPLWNAPTRAGRFFGRQGQVEEILALWQEHRCVAITGMGGLGKTALAGEVLARLAPATTAHSTASRRLLLHDFYRQPSHLSALDALLRQAGHDPRELTEDQMETQLATELNQPDTYLYFEGCEKAADLSALLALTGSAKVLLTLRGQVAPAGTFGWSLPPLSIPDAAALIAYLAGVNTSVIPSSYLDLASFLGGHALACRLAGMVLKEQIFTAPELLDELKSAGLATLDTQKREHESVDWLLRQTALAIAAEKPDCLRLWYVLALGALSPLPLSLLGDMLAMDKKAMRPLLKALQDRGILLTDTLPPESGPEPEPAAQLAHALIQTWVLRDLPTLLPEGQNLDIGKTYTTWRDVWRHYLYRCNKNMSMIGGHRRQEALLSQLETLLQRMHEIEPIDSTQHALVLNELAVFYHHSGRLVIAEHLYGRILKIDEASYGPNHPEVARDLNNLAQLLKATNRLGEAEPLMVRVVEICETVYGKEHPNVATALNNLALLFQDTSRLSEAEPLMRRVAAIFETVYGKEHPDVAAALNNLAQLLQDMNHLGEAEPLMWRALKIDEASYGPDHPEVARDLHNLAALLQAMNRLGEAEELMERVVGIFETAYGKEHPKVALALNNLATLLQATNRLREAEPLYRHALMIDEACYGPDHPEVARDLNNLASLLYATNRLGEAEPLMRRHLVIFLKFLASTGHQHPHQEAAIRNYVALLREMGRTQEEIIEKLQEAGAEAGLKRKE